MGCCDGNKGNKKTFMGHSLFKAGKSIIKHFVDPTYNAFSSEEEKKRRIDICMNCKNKEVFMGKNRCKICYCFIEPKASLIDQWCPDPDGNKWKKEE